MTRMDLVVMLVAASVFSAMVYGTLWLRFESPWAWSQWTPIHNCK